MKKNNEKDKQEKLSMKKRDKRLNVILTALHKIMIRVEWLNTKTRIEIQKDPIRPFGQ